MALNPDKKDINKLSGEIKNNALLNNKTGHNLKTIPIKIHQELFEFTGYINWISTAAEKFDNSGCSFIHIICIDSDGNVCASGKHFKYAENNNLYPITAYRIGD